MKNRLPVVLALTILCGPLSIAKSKHAPLPRKLLDARTIYIDNRSGSASLGDAAYQEIQKLGRFRITETAKQADVTMVITAEAVPSGSYTSGHVDKYGNIGANSRPIDMVYSCVTVVDPLSGDALWQDRKHLTIFHDSNANIKGLVKELDDRLREQQKSK